MTKKRKVRKKETERLTDLLNRSVRKSPVKGAPEVLVPGAEGRVRRTIDVLQKAAAHPREEILGRAEKAVVEQVRRLLKWNEGYGLSVSELLRTGARYLLSFPLRRPRS